MDWKSDYDAKRTSAAKAMECVKSGDRVVFAHACGEPLELVDALVARDAAESAKREAERRETEDSKADVVFDTPDDDPFDEGAAPDIDPPDEPPPSNAAPPPPEDDDPFDTRGAGPSAAATKKAKKPRKKTVQNMDWLCENWVWIVGPEKFVRKEDHLMWSRKQFDSKFNHLTEKTSLAAALFHKSTSTTIDRYERAVFRPGDPPVIGADYNLWRPSRIVPAEGNTDSWNEHINYLFQNDDDRKSVLNWMAWVLQNPKLKPNHALLLVGKNTGTG